MNVSLTERICKATGFFNSFLWKSTDDRKKDGNSINPLGAELFFFVCFILKWQISSSSVGKAIEEK